MPSSKSNLLKGLRKSFKLRSTLQSKAPNSTCHMSRLPNEILCEIFLNYLHIYSPDAPNKAGIPNLDSFWHRKAPYVSEYSLSDPEVISQVCSAWRKASLGYPALWSRMLIIGPLSKFHVLIIKRWLHRSSDHPLELSFKEFPQKSHNGLAIEVLQSFFAHSSHWKSIRLQVDLSLLEMISEMTEWCKPCTNLEFAGLVIPNSFPMPGDSQLFDKAWKFFHSSPVLRRVVLPPLPNNALLPHTPTMQLISVDLLSYATIADLLLVISRCPLLEEVKTEFLNVPSDSPTFVPTSVITHQNLRNLTISAAPELHLDIFFAGITLPSLAFLRLIHTTPKFATFRNFLHRSKCQLQELTAGVKGNLDPYIQLEELNSLTVFQVTTADVTDRAIELLLLRKRNSFLFLPHLEVLHLSAWRASDGMLSRFFSARSCIPAKLGDYTTMALPDLDRSDSVPRPTSPERVGEQVAFSFRPLPEGPIDSTFLKRNYEWLSDVYKWMALSKMLRAVCLQ